MMRIGSAWKIEDRARRVAVMLDGTSAADRVSGFVDH